MMEPCHILWHYARARRAFTRWRDRESLAAWQEGEVRRHLARVAGKAPFFREKAQRHGVEDWRQWPVSGKTEMMSRFDTWNTAGIRLDDAWALAVGAERTRDFSRTLGGITVGLSSGTSGSRGVFLASARERRMWAGTLLARTLRGTLMHPHRAALFLRADSPLYRTVGSRRFRFEFFDLLRPMEEHRARLLNLRPTLLAAPPSVLSQLATDGRARELLAPPAIVLSVADVLDEPDRRGIERGFGCSIGQVYQATEGFLAAACSHGRLHWNEDAIVVQKEWLDSARTRYAPVITDFRRFTQPIVRHRLDDVIVEDAAGACPCGSVFGTLAAIEGRCDDILALPRLDGRGEVTVFPDFVRRAIVLGVPPGVDYAVAQTAPEQWELSFSRECDVAPVRQEVAELCRRLNARCPELRVVPWRTPSPDAKRRRVRRCIPECMPS